MTPFTRPSLGIICRPLAILSTLIVLLGATHMRPAGAEPQQPDQQQTEDLEQVIFKVRDAVTPAVCATFFFQGPANGQRAGTAVVISEDGYVLTHAHHRPLLRPGDQVGVAVDDGRNDLATVVGVDRILDLTLLRLNGSGPWPFVKIGKSHDMKHSDLCIAIGYPKSNFGNYAESGQSAKPMLRVGQFLGRSFQSILTSCRISGGDSGGPVFNSRGELIGITHGANPGEDHPIMYTHVSTEVFLDIRSDLESGVFRENEPGIKTMGANATLPSSANPLTRSIVAVECDGTTLSHGVIVDADGLILTKASVLTGEIRCRLSDNSVLPAIRLAVLREHDLALLKVERQGLPSIDWANIPLETSPEIGTVVLTVLPSGKPIMGVVGLDNAPLPRERGQLLLETSDPGDGQGIIIQGVGQSVLSKFLKPQDRVTHMEGELVLTGSDFVSVRERLLDDPSWSVGDQLRLQIVREGRKMQVEVPIVSETNMAFRYRGFSHVYSHDSPLQQSMTGTLLVNLKGEIVGITIVASDVFNPPFCSALPMRVVRNAVNELRRGAAQGNPKP